MERTTLFFWLDSRPGGAFGLAAVAQRTRWIDGEFKQSRPSRIPNARRSREIVADIRGDLGRFTIEKAKG